MTKSEAVASMRSDLALLSDFNEQVVRLERTRFAKRYATEIPQVMVSMENLEVTNLGNGQLNLFGKLKSWVPDFDDEEITAFVSTYRILTQNNDRLSLANVSKIYS